MIVGGKIGEFDLSTPFIFSRILPPISIPNILHSALTDIERFKLTVMVDLQVPFSTSN